MKTKPIEKNWVPDTDAKEILINSGINEDFIDKEVLCAETAQEIFDLGVKYQYDKERIRHLWEVVKRDHTYMNRCNGMLKIIDGV